MKIVIILLREENLVNVLHHCAFQIFIGLNIPEFLYHRTDALIGAIKVVQKNKKKQNDIFDIRPCIFTYIN